MPTTRRFRQALIATLGMVAAAAFPTEARAQISSAEKRAIKAEMNRAEVLEAERKFDQAITLLEGTLARVKRLVQPGNEFIGGVSLHLGKAYFDGGKFELAEPMFREAAKVGKTLADDSSDMRYTALNGLVGTLTKLARYDEAIPLGQEALQEAETRFGVGDWRTNMARHSLANPYFFAKRFTESIPICQTCLRYAEAKFQADSPETIRFRNNLAVALTESGQYVEAKRLFEQSRDIARRKLKPDDEMTTTTSNGLAVVNQRLGPPSDAVDLARKQLEAVQGRAGARPSARVEALNGLAVACQGKEQYFEAEEKYRQALDLARAELDPLDPMKAAVLNNLATMLIANAHFIEAEQYIREFLTITAQKPGRDTVAYATGNVTLGAIYANTNRSAEAAPLLVEALKIMEARLDKGHPDIATVRHNLATLSWLTGDYRKSIQEGERSLAELRLRFGGDNHSTAVVLVNLGQSYLGIKNFEKSEECLKKALAILEAEPWAATADLSKTRNALAELYIETKRYEQAEALYRKNIADNQVSLGQSHPDMATAIDNLTMCLILQGRQVDALNEMDGSRKSRRDFLLRTLPALSESDQFSLIDKGERITRDLALMMAVKRRADPGVADRSAEWVINSKAITIRALATAAVLARDATNPRSIQLLGELNTTRGRLAQFALARDKDGKRPVEAADDYKTMARRELDLAQELGLALGKPVVEKWTEISALRAALPDDAVLVEFANIFTSESKIRADDPSSPRLARYAAWVIPPVGRGDVSLVDLGPADTLDQAVADALRAIQAPGVRGIADDDQPAAERKALAALRVLSGRLYQPLAKHLGPAKRWVLGLDSALWLVPWAALPVAEGRYAVEDHLIHFVISGLDLLAPPPTGNSGLPAILANPDYDLAPGKAKAIARERGRVRPPARGSTTKRAALPDFLRNDGVKSLPGTEAEANAVAPLLKEYLGTKLDMFVGAEASETVFKGLHAPKVLVLSTHGFFFREPDATQAPGGSAPSPLANPLLRCGLLFAGFNQRAAGPSTGEVDDGIVTGLEIVGADLRGTDLVVLSACETAKGDVRAGEGVAGLRQAFQIAGADSVVATLWQVADDESYQLMSGFFQGLARRRGPATALREAQLAMIADRRARLKAAHPYYWAAYTLTGFPGPAWREEAVTIDRLNDLPRLPPPLSDPKRGSVSNVSDGFETRSHVTGRRGANNPWADGASSALLLVGGGFLTRWWWRNGVGIRLGA